jgi:Domain of unknown function (DUF4838)
MAIQPTGNRNQTTPDTQARFDTRGVVLINTDLTLAEWPTRAAQAGLNTIALHAPGQLEALAVYLRGGAGQQFLADCQRLGLRVEYELHAMSDLLPRDLFNQEPGLFRMDKAGRRTPQFNCCPSSSRALEIIAARAAEYASIFRPTTGRYYYWPDDVPDWCCCEFCREYNPSDQALLIENAILRELRRHIPQATLSHLAYDPTLTPPGRVKPEPGIFLEFAPIGRSHDQPFVAQTDPALADRLDVLDANLAVFPRHTAQVLEYWLDVSRFSKWQRPAVKLPWRPEVLRADLDAYAARGIRHVTSFACYIDADYVQLHGSPWEAIADYGQALKDNVKGGRSETC